MEEYDSVSLLCHHLNDAYDCLDECQNCGHFCYLHYKYNGNCDFWFNDDECCDCNQFLDNK